ncbi:MAG: hypothetical protein ACP6IP_02365 [Candidatus Njordarchaeia archaeon]
MKDPCKKLVNDAKKRVSILKMGKDYWSGAILYIQAAECYKASGEKEKAFESAVKASELLRKYAEKYGYELVINDLIKSLTIARSVAPEEDAKRIKLELFNIYNLHAKLLIQSGNYIGSVDKFLKALEFAPSGKEAKNMLSQAITILEDVANKKIMQGKQKYASKLLEKIEELRMLLPTEEIEEETEILPEKKSRIRAVFSYSDNPADVKKRIVEKLNELGMNPLELSEKRIGAELNLKFVYPNDTTVKVQLTTNRIILDVEGFDQKSVIGHYTTFKEIIENVVFDAEPLLEEIEAEINKKIITSLLEDLKEKVTVGTTYRNLLTRLNSIVALMKKKEKTPKNWNTIMKILQKIVDHIKKVHGELLNYDILGEEIASIVNQLNEAIEKMEKS